MATAREMILSGPYGNVTGHAGLPFLRTLFRNFCDYAQTHYTYSATKMRGSEGSLLLAYATTETRIVDCGSLACALSIMARDDLGLTDASLECVGSSACIWATREHSRCFDAAIAGNVRTAWNHFKLVGRCVFAQHWFVRAGGGYYDPCLLTTYEKPADAQAWSFDAAYGAYNGVLYRIIGEPNVLMIRIPPGHKPPYGFMSAFLQVETKDLDKAAYKDAFRIDKPGWQARTKSVNELLHAAGIAESWDDIK